MAEETINYRDKLDDAKRLKFDRYFTSENENPLEKVSYNLREIKIEDRNTKKTILHIKDFEAPSSWSQNAADIVASKYARKKGVPKEYSESGVEMKVRDIVSRVADSISDFGFKNGYFATKIDADNFRDELRFLLINQYAAFNSPVWFNEGLEYQYGIKGEKSGNWRFDPVKGETVQVEDSYTYPQNSACFIQSVEDSLEGLLELQKNEVLLFKYGSGTGTNFKNIREKGAPLSNGGEASGVMSFLKGPDAWAGAIKSGGTTRRAAKMVILPENHPEILEFIHWKAEGEKMVKDLIAMGYPIDFEGITYAAISGQNSNNSVRVTDKFMRGIENDGTYDTISRISGKVHSTLKNKEVYEEIIKAAHYCADPGLQFHDTINKWNTCKNSGQINASNPCSEYMFLDDSACNLASLNLLKFYNPETEKFDIESYRRAIDIVFTAQEIIVEKSSYPTEAIAKNSYDYRPIGLGYANIGALLMSMGLPYDSDKGRKVATSLTAILTGEAYKQSAKIAEVKGPFNTFEKNKEPFMEVMNMHRDATNKISDEFSEYEELRKTAINVWNETIELGEENGYRNAQATVLAPTGTIAFMMDCDTTGIEPDPSLVKYKKLVGGGSMIIENQSISVALRRLGYNKQEIDKISGYARENNTVEGAPDLKEEHYAIFDTAFKSEKATRFIPLLGHVKMMAAVQSFLSGAISKTVNLPKEATLKDVEEAYTSAWEFGLKSIALYRDGSKDQPLNTSKGNKLEKELKWGDRKKPKDTREAVAQKFYISSPYGNTEFVLHTGEYPDGSLAEFFIRIIDTSDYDANISAWTKDASKSLQYGRPLDNLIETHLHTKSEPQGFVKGFPGIKKASSLHNLVVRYLGIQYLGNLSLADVPDEIDKTTLRINRKNLSENEKNSKNNDKEITKKKSEKNDTFKEVQKKKQGLMGSGHPCKKCGATTQRAGTCFVCTNCGEDTGCG